MSQGCINERVKRTLRIPEAMKFVVMEILHSSLRTLSTVTDRGSSGASSQVNLVIPQTSQFHNFLRIACIIMKAQ